jgi:general stress protein CsbA
VIQELEDFLTAEWIVVADACAIFAGYVPLEDRKSVV